MVVDSNMYWFDESIFEDEQMLEAFISEVPELYGTRGKRQTNPNGTRQIVIEKPAGFQNLNYVQGEYRLEQQLASEHFLLLHEISIMYGLCIKACRSAGFEPRVIYTGSRAENIMELVVKGMGVSLLMNKTSRELKNDQIALVNIEPAVNTNVMLYYRKGTKLSDAARHFVRYVQEYSGK